MSSQLAAKIASKRSKYISTDVYVLRIRFLYIRPIWALKVVVDIAPGMVLVCFSHDKSDPMTSWNASGAYNPDKYYTEASDKSGRGDPINARIPPQIGSSIAALVQSGVVSEYRTLSDFVRDAVVHRLHTIGEKIQSGEIQRRVNMVAMLNEEIQTQREKEDYFALISMIETRHMEYSAKSMSQANQYLKGRLAEIDAIPGDYQADYERRLSAKLYPV